MNNFAQVTNTLCNSLDNSFWQFSLRVYQDEKVKEACLLFQNREGINVNLLLLCCWLSYAVERVSENEFEEACHSVAGWQLHVTQAIRKTRQYLKKNFPNEWIETFYQGILGAELSSEAYQQHNLYNYFVAKLKKTPGKNEELLLYYLYRLFDEMKLVMDKELDLRIQHFAELILTKMD